MVPGSVVRTVNTLHDDVTLAAGSNVTITPSGNTLTIASAGVGGSGIWSVNGNNAYYNAGTVGIGTIKSQGRCKSPAAAWRSLAPAVPTPELALGSLWSQVLPAALSLLLTTPRISHGSLLLNNPGGNVGIGTISPQAQLHVYDPANSVTDLIETGGGVNAWAKTAFKDANGEWDIGTSRGFNADVFYIDRIGTSALEFQLAPNGDLGLGVTPLAKLHLFDPASSVSHRIETAGGVNAWTRFEFANGNGQWDVGTSRGYNGDQLYFAREGAANASFAIQPNGDTFANGNMSVCTLTIRGGCDLAEPFPMQDVIEKGSVVVIDMSIRAN